MPVQDYLLNALSTRFSFYTLRYSDCLWQSTASLSVSYHVQLVDGMLTKETRIAFNISLCIPWESNSWPRRCESHALLCELLFVFYL